MGTETSKYQEEKKTKVIPLVAASEKGEAQTRLRLGVVGPQEKLQMIVEVVGKLSQRE